MAEIKAADVSKLRKATGAGMMDCKKALQEADGDFEKAIDVIRKKGQIVASKRADREAGEGTVQAKVKGNFGAIISLNCETDFVAKNENFVAFAKSILDRALEERPRTLDDLRKLKLEDKSVEEKIIEQTGIIGEKLELTYYDYIESAKVIEYNHFGNNLATLVGFNKADVDNQVAKDVAMQVAAMSPVSIDKDDVPEEIIRKEREIGREKALQEGKPESIVDRIAEGMVQKFLKESTLLNQDFTKDSKKTIAQYLKEADKELKVTGFKRFSIK
ncbi:MAG: elongation factor Ts [Bacteroidales bacterium]|nr:elongation factor Ts [Bacteroidales bacterium]MBN2698678.1 elongation factor Ts [Bacteroidales bacterium]